MRALCDKKPRTSNPLIDEAVFARGQSHEQEDLSGPLEEGIKLDHLDERLLKVFLGLVFFSPPALVPPLPLPFHRRARLGLFRIILSEFASFLFAPVAKTVLFVSELFGAFIFEPFPVLCRPVLAVASLNPR